MFKFFNVALFANLVLLASEALPLPSGLGSRLSQPSQNQLLKREAGGGSWAGVVLTEEEGTFNTVTGTFTVPTVSGPAGAFAAALVGLDGYTCTSAFLQAGVNFTVNANGVATYNAWYQWFPAPAYNFSDITVSSGDEVILTIQASSSTSGAVMIENSNTGQSVSQDLTSPVPLCEENAEWVVEGYVEGSEPIPLADFGIFTFVNAFAGPYHIPTSSDATILNIEQNGQIVAAAQASGSTATIIYE